MSSQLPTAPPPTAFFNWCSKNKFGVDSPKTVWKAFPGKMDLPGTPSGDLEFSAWTKCATIAEAAGYLTEVEQSLRHVAQDLRVDIDPPVAETSDTFTIRYRTERIQGTLTGMMELRDNGEGAKTLERYFVRLHLIERGVDR